MSVLRGRGEGNGVGNLIRIRAICCGCDEVNFLTVIPGSEKVLYTGESYL